MGTMGFADDQANVVIKATSKLSSRGQIVIPIEIRKTLGLIEGDDLTFILNKDGEIKVEVLKKQRLSELFGILKTNKPFQPVDEVRKEVYRNMAEKELTDREEG
ncbi:AbrB/MazE/SpoVT family DNA-binding domain-containing protein [Anoxybacillus sp. J5B_2022]|uniref:AbrB/MazE/SpoVT family DNA-binding domain-containing protein n=1 Tax=Anoxybacillus sp. J5B_2022 TaxID=3003246 RepID=UPI0022859EDE|nr:AbrB/MazE/SpoVT family DNA-binding domain-containing protein [Anoxybacillus sp. J5B_2022]MCZ0755170.1 AbrB/MazE/SpoVT family DNA-binding domain-containing protein [Anoxybacillus sp. J5B_2022]